MSYIYIYINIFICLFIYLFITVYHVDILYLVITCNYSISYYCKVLKTVNLHNSIQFHSSSVLTFPSSAWGVLAVETVVNPGSSPGPHCRCQRSSLALSRSGSHSEVTVKSKHIRPRSSGHYVDLRCKRTLKYDACKVLLDLEVQDGIGNRSNGKVLRTSSLTHLASCVVKYTCHLKAFRRLIPETIASSVVFGTFKGCQTMPCLAPSKLSAAQKLGLGCMVRIECIDKRDHKKGNKTHQWPSACPQSDGFDELQLAQKGTTQHQIYTDNYRYMQWLC